MYNNLKSFTMADRRSSRFHISDIQRKAVAFTMAEILLSLTIIGVVAAITLPSLTGNINERTWNTQRKALYARMSQAIALMGSLNGYGTYNYNYTDDGTLSIVTDTAANTFVTEGLSKVIKINNICDSNHLSDCGINSSLYTTTNNKINFPRKISEWNSKFTRTTGYVSYLNSQRFVNTSVVGIETQNGESIALLYNPFCQGNLSDTYPYLPYPKMCLNMIYDLNGKKGPNTVGKDIGFITVLYPSDSIIVAPNVLNINAISVNVVNSQAKCRAMNEDARVPNIYELISIYFNYALLGIDGSDYGYLSSTKNETGWLLLNFVEGYVRNMEVSPTTSVYLRCVKR